MFRRFIRPLYPSHHPQYHDKLLIYFLQNHFWKIGWNHGIIVTQNFFLDSINLLLM